MEKTYPYIPYSKESYPEPEMIVRSKAFYQWMDQRRTVRDFSSQPIPKEVLENLILTASTAPSGAHKQPWTFCVVTNPDLKKQIRLAAEKEEYESYHGRMTDEWLDDLAPLGTNWEKLIIVFKRVYEIENEQKKNNYYVTESVGLAAGFLLTAIHNAGLVALTHTPSPMNFLCKLLDRPENERPFLLIPVGYLANNTQVPDLKRKTLEQMHVFYE